DNALEDARASTLRSRLTLKTATVSGFTALLEADDVMTIGADDYNSFMTDDSHFGTHSVVADPVGTEINQAWLKYGFSAEASATVGRQRINHAGQRFVGGVGWRQNEQTYDALAFNYAADGYTLDYSYIWNVNRIFDGSGTSSQAAEFDSKSHILLATAAVPGGKLSGFVYALDFEEAAALSSITYGLGYDGVFDAFAISASIATQSDYGDNATSYDALYLALEGKVKINPVTLVAGYELLGSDDGIKGFTTPLATLHKFQGWADVFLATPNNGIEGIYGGVTGAIDKVALGAFYHDFSSDEGSVGYGSEVNLVATYPVNQYLSVELKYADYNADDFSVDTEKVWFSIMLNF
ncbi:MAG: alginate export family protein, partial [Porticoccaceae bacterium]